MDNPEGEQTTINVKGVSVKAWTEARNAANKAGDTMGIWLSRAISAQANLEAGPREFPPGSEINLSQKPANPSLTPDQLTERIQAVAALLQGMAAVKAATGKATGRGAVARVLGSLEGLQAEADAALTPRLAGKAGGKELLRFGKASRDLDAVDG